MMSPGQRREFSRFACTVRRATYTNTHIVCEGNWYPVVDTAWPASGVNVLTAAKNVPVNVRCVSQSAARSNGPATEAPGQSTCIRRSIVSVHYPALHHCCRCSILRGDPAFTCMQQRPVQSQASSGSLRLVCVPSVPLLTRTLGSGAGSSSGPWCLRQPRRVMQDLATLPRKSGAVPPQATLRRVYTSAMEAIEKLPLEKLPLESLPGAELGKRPQVVVLAAAALVPLLVLLWLCCRPRASKPKKKQS